MDIWVVYDLSAWVLSLQHNRDRDSRDDANKFRSVYQLDARLLAVPAFKKSEGHMAPTHLLRGVHPFGGRSAKCLIEMGGAIKIKTIATRLKCTKFDCGSWRISHVFTIMGRAVSSNFFVSGGCCCIIAQLRDFIPAAREIINCRSRLHGPCRPRAE